MKEIKLAAIAKCIGIGITCGIVVPLIGGLLFPSMLINVGGPLIISNSQKILLIKNDYSYKPGQQGIQYNYFRVSTDGKKENVTIELLFFSILIYSAISTILAFIIYIIFYLRLFNYH